VRPEIRKELCVGCGSCLEVCPVDAIHLSLGVASIEEGFCEECGMCAQNCPTKAIEIKFPTFEAK